MRLSSPQHRLLLGMRRGLVRGKRRPTAIRRHGADGSARVPAVAVELQLLYIPAVDTPPELVHRHHIHVVVAAQVRVSSRAVHITPRGPSLFPISQPPGSTVSIMYNDGMSLISIILSAIVLAWLDSYLRRQSELRIPPNEHGSVVLRANAINARLGWYALAIAFLFAIGAIFYAGSLRETVTFVALAGATGLGGVLLIAYYRIMQPEVWTFICGHQSASALLKLT